MGQGPALGRDLLENFVEDTLRLELVNDGVAVKFVQFWVLGNSTLEPIEKLVLLQVLLDDALDLVHLGIGDSRACLSRRRWSVLHVILCLLAFRLFCLFY